MKIKLLLYYMSDIDYIIVGAGPTGLTLAWLLSKYRKKVLIIDKNHNVGGAHRVKRVNGLFTEHSPRMYSSSYQTLKHIMKDMGMDFNDYFSIYDYRYYVMSYLIQYFSLYEVFTFLITFIGLNENYKNITMEEYTKDKKFSKKAIYFVDRICRMFEGSDITRHTLYQFIEYVNNSLFNRLYILNKPTDKGLLKEWKNKLEDNGVKFMMNSNVVNIIQHNKKIKYLVARTSNGDNIIMKAKNYILATPPTAIVKLLKHSNALNAFGNFNILSKWESNVKYNDYIAVIFHWNKKIKIKSKWGFPHSSWGLITQVLTDYIDFQDPRSKFVISSCISIQDQEYNGKKAQDCTKSEIIDLAFKQLKELYPSLPHYSHALMEHNVYRNNKWQATTDGYLLTKYGGIDFRSKYENLYTCGTHNDKSDYPFTTMESSMDNAMKLANQLVPQTKNDYKVRKKC